MVTLPNNQVGASAVMSSAFLDPGRLSPSKQGVLCAAAASAAGRGATGAGVAAAPPPPPPLSSLPFFNVV